MIFININCQWVRKIHELNRSQKDSNWAQPGSDQANLMYQLIQTFLKIEIRQMYNVRSTWCCFPKYLSVQTVYLFALHILLPNLQFINIPVAAKNWIGGNPMNINSIIFIFFSPDFFV